MDLHERVKLLGYRRDIASLLQQSQIFALITHWESFPRSIIEAMRARLPIVATAVGGTAEAVLHGRTGFVVPGRDVDALASHLRLLIENSDLRRKLGAAGRRRYEAHFTFSLMVAKTARVWESLLGRPIVIDHCNLPADS